MATPAVGQGRAKTQLCPTAVGGSTFLHGLGPKRSRVTRLAVSANSWSQCAHGSYPDGKGDRPELPFEVATKDGAPSLLRRPRGKSEAQTSARAQ